MRKDRRVEERLATLRQKIAQYDPGLCLTDEELDNAEEVGAEGLRLLYGMKAENDSRIINALCDEYEPRLTKILYDKRAA